MVKTYLRAPTGRYFKSPWLRIAHRIPITEVLVQAASATLFDRDATLALLDLMRHRGYVYMLRFSNPLGDPTRPRSSARYYIGFASHFHALLDRLYLHAHCPDHPGAARIITAAHRAGITFELVRLWPGYGREFERYLKKRGHYERMDPTVYANALNVPAPATIARFRLDYDGLPF